MIRYSFANAVIASREFHRYILDWYPDRLVFRVDEVEILQQPFAPSAPFATIPEYLVLSLAVGGLLGGDVDRASFPMDMTIDYVRVYAF